MPDTWIFDLRHYLSEKGEIAVLPGPARSLASYMAEIVAVTTDPTMQQRITCRRRPSRKPCSGLVESYVDSLSSEVVWQCTVCGDRGIITNWQNTLWDLSAPERRH